MGTKGVSESAKKKRRASAPIAMARSAKAAEGAAGDGQQTASGKSLAAEGNCKKPPLVLADALRSKAKKKAFAKQQLEEARVVVLDCLPAIVKALSAKSAKSYLTAKFLFDFAELEKISVDTGGPGRPKSLQAVLKKLGFEEQRRRDRISTGVTDSSGN